VSILSSLAKYVPQTASVTVERMTRVGSTKQLVVVNNTAQNPISMLIQPKTEIWRMRGGQAIENQYTWVVAVPAGSPEPDLQQGDVITGYRNKQLELRSVNFYEGPYPYLGGILTDYSHQA
jgi:hypothetical protein